MVTLPEGAPETDLHQLLQDRWSMRAEQMPTPPGETTYFHSQHCEDALPPSTTAWATQTDKTKRQTTVGAVSTARRSLGVATLHPTGPWDLGPRVRDLIRYQFHPTLLSVCWAQP